MSSLPLMSAWSLPFVLHLPPILGPSVLLHLVPATAILSLLLQPHAVLTLLSSVGIIRITLTRHRSVVHHVLGWETSWQEGG